MTKLIPRITITEHVLDEIKATIGSVPAETGGVLGGNPLTGAVTDFFYDRQADTSPHVYTVVPERINAVIAEWNSRDIHLMGIAHSHPPGSVTPSRPDIEFAHRLLSRSDNVALPQFVIPIVQSCRDVGTFSLRLFTVVREAPTIAFEVPYRIVPAPVAFPVEDPRYARIFARVHSSHDLPRLHEALAACIGCGGSAGFVEDLARAGVGRFLLVDPDTVSESNLATQAQYLRDIGRPKVEALRDRILDINPFARVEIRAASFDAFSDADLRDLLFGDEAVSTRLLCGMTDDFWTQWRISLVALNFGLSALFAQVYRAGAAAEVVFTHPDTTNQCARCVLSKRFDAYTRDGFQNNAGSEGAQYLATPRLNALKLFVALALLHHGSAHPFWGPMLSRLGQRNLALVRCSPDAGETLGLQQFTHAFAGAAPEHTFTDETVWRPQHPENPANGYAYSCPDCGGTGNLRNGIGRFADTRELVRSAREAAQTET